MTVSTFVQTNAGTQPVNTYNSNLDGNISVFARLGAAFAPHAQVVPNMTVAIDAGHIFNGLALTEVAAQSTAAIVPPTTNPRIDRIVVNQVTGAVSVVAGAEAATPVPPALPAGSIPVAQIAIQPSTTSIANSLITDERALSALGTSGGLLGVQTFATPGTYTYTPTPGTTKIIVEVQGGGGAGGVATSNATQGATAGGGGSGSYARSFLTSGFSAATVSVGAGGILLPGNTSGPDGGVSSFGTIIAPGGRGGPGGQWVNPPAMSYLRGQAAVATGGNIINARGSLTSRGLLLGTTRGSFGAYVHVAGGAGGASYFGEGGAGGGEDTSNNDGKSAEAPGSGGGGGTAFSGIVDPGTGGNGANGIVIVYEYS